MTDEPDLTTQEGGETRLYRPAAEGGLEAAAPEESDYREGLRSRRWDAAPLTNPEVEKTDPRIAVAAIIIMAVLTFVVLIVGYGAGLWELPA